MRRAGWMLCGAVTALGVAAPSAPPTAPPAPDEVGALLQRCQQGERADRDRAWQELERRRDADYAALLARYEAAPEGHERTALEHLLRLPELRAAAHVFVGALDRVTHDQGGVVDYHWLTGHLREVRVLRADADTRALLEQHGQFQFVRGTSRDWWLCDVIRRDLEPIAGAWLWLAAPRDLEYAYGGAPTRVVVQQYQRLPAAAADAVAAWLAAQEGG